MNEVININSKLPTLNPVQKKAFALIEADIRFLCSFIELQENPKLDSNYVMMALPYMGLIVDGVEEWGTKVGLGVPEFSDVEKNCYEIMRNSIKHFETGFDNYCSLLYSAFNISDKHFFNTRSLMSKIKRLYYNVGTDVVGEKFCGNTILCFVYAPYFKFSKEYEKFLRDVFIVAGELAAQYGGTQMGVYAINPQTKFTYKDFHFFNDCPLKTNNFSDFVLFSVLCSINYVLLFVNKYFIDEFPAKLRFAYTLYYYLADFIKDANDKLSTTFHIDKKYLNQQFRNCMAHYGLGQVMKETDIIESDSMMFGLTDKFFSKSYFELKECIYSELQNLADQLEYYLLK